MKLGLASLNPMGKISQQFYTRGGSYTPGSMYTSLGFRLDQGSSVPWPREAWLDKQNCHSNCSVKDDSLGPTITVSVTVEPGTAS